MYPIGNNHSWEVVICQVHGLQSLVQRLSVIYVNRKSVSFILENTRMCTVKYSMLSARDKLNVI